MKKLYFLIIFISLSFLSLGLAHKALAQDVCYLGSGQGVIPLERSYSDYGQEGYVQFHLQFTGNPWTINSLRVDGYNANCSSAESVTKQGPANLPIVTHMLIKVLPQNGGGFNITVYNEDDNAVIQQGLGISLDNFNYGAVGLTFIGDQGSFNTPVGFMLNPNAPQKTPVLIVPGIMGTEIFKGQEQLWPDITKMILSIGDGFMDPLAFKNDTMPLDSSLSLGDVVKEEPGFDYTTKLVTDLKAQGYQEGVDLFTFPYDWRKDNSDIANQNLTGQIDYILNQTHAQKVDIIAHSQGGLVVKKLLLDQPQYELKINKLIMVGVPNLGAPMAAKILLYGDSVGVGYKKLMFLDPQEIKKISHNMPAVYQLLPSQEYFNHTQGYLGALSNVLNGAQTFTFNDYNGTKTALNSSGLNSALLDTAEAFHSSNYDNLDFTGSGMQTYNIVGCTSGTAATIGLRPGGKFKLFYGAGDGTVPIKSATNIFGATTYYAYSQKIAHGTMLTDDGTRQLIVSLVVGNNNPSASISLDPSNCVYGGQEVEVHSPADLSIYNESNNHVGPNSDGSFDMNIPGVQFDSIGEEKFAFLPDGHSYKIVLKGTGNGTMDFYHSKIQGDNITSEAYFSSVPVTTTTTATIDLTGDNALLQLDTNTDGTIDQTIQPSSILTAEQSQDLTAPISTATITGTQGQPGFFRSNVSITLVATDPIIPGQETQTSGILKTQYNLDNQGYQSYAAPLLVSSEGPHTVTFFSTDKAGNSDDPKNLNFSIDKTAPEAVIQFNFSQKDLQFTGTDNISTISAIVVLDNDDQIKLTDQAGNITQLTLKDKDRKHKLKAEIKTLSYNGQDQDLSKNVLHFDWNLDRVQTLKTLNQQVKSKKEFNIQAQYQPDSTKLSGKDKNGNISQTLTGLVLLKIFTNKGDLQWSY